MKYFYHSIVLLILLMPLSAQEKVDINSSQLTPVLENDTIPESIEKTNEGKDISVEPSIFDKRKLLSEDHVTKIKEVQQEFYSKYKCMVSYGFYDGHLPSIAVHQAWKDMVAIDEKHEFHLFINVGVLRKKNILEIYYRYPPALKNIREIDTVLANLERDLQSEIGLDSFLKRSYESVNDELAYIGSKPNFESNAQKDVNAFEATKLKAYLFKILKIAGFILGPLIALLILWSIFSKLRNKLSYRFPDVEYIERFGSKHSATSIAKIRK